MACSGVIQSYQLTYVTAQMAPQSISRPDKESLLALQPRFTIQRARKAKY